MADEMVSLLKDCKLFAKFSNDQLEKVVAHLQPRMVELKSGERVYKKGDRADRCWLIHSGQLTVQKSSLRTPFRKMLYHKGSVTGIQGLVNPGSERVVTMIADGKVKLVEITQEGISRLDDATQIQLWKNVSKVLLGKLSLCLARETLND